MFTHKAFAHEVLHMRCSRVKCLHMRYICRFLAQFQKNLFKIFTNQASTRPAFVTCSMKGGGKAWKDLSRVWRPGNEARALMYYGVA